MMLKEELSIPNVLGLHTRAASKMVDCACRFQSRIVLNIGAKKADAKRIMEVMLLGAKFKDTVIIEVEGDDQELAFKACVDLIQSGFGELQVDLD